MAVTAPPRPASQKQVDFLWKLVAERQPLGWMDPDGEWAADLDAKSASNLISEMLNQPRTSLAHEDGNAVGEGYYITPIGEVYQVVKAKSTGNLYAKRFTTAGYEYSPGAMRNLTSAERLTVEQAAKMGKATGRCVVCARLLTAEQSVTQGIGPICAGRL